VITATLMHASWEWQEKPDLPQNLRLNSSAVYQHGKYLLGPLSAIETGYPGKCVGDDAGSRIA
jgi:hypothetical protein